MHYFKSIICLLIFSSCFFTEAQAQLEVAGDGSVRIGTTGYSGRQLNVYNNTQAFGFYTGSYNLTGTNHGLRSYVASTTAGTRYGISTYIYSSTASSGTVYGLHSTVTSGGTGNRYAVYASAPTGTNRYAGYFAGDLHVTGSISLVAPPPTQLQKMPMSNMVSKLEKLQTIAYQGKNNRINYTLDAESLKKVFPELVYEVEQPAQPNAIEGEEGVASKTKPTVSTAIDYNSLIPILLQSIQELKQEIEVLKAEK